MGQSTDGILFYGYCWKEQCNICVDEEGNETSREWQEEIALRRGHINPWKNYPDTSKLPYEQQRQVANEWCNTNRAALDTWRSAKDTIEKDFGCDIYYHCSCEYAMPYVCVEASRTCARRGYPESINPHKMTNAEQLKEWDALLERFMTELDIPKPEGQDRPQWWLASMWG